MQFIGSIVGTFFLSVLKFEHESFQRSDKISEQVFHK